MGIENGGLVGIKIHVEGKKNAHYFGRSSGELLFLSQGFGHVIAAVGEHLKNFFAIRVFYMKAAGPDLKIEVLTDVIGSYGYHGRSLFVPL